MRLLARLLRALPLLLISPLVVALSILALGLVDLIWLVAGRKRPPVPARPSTRAASVVIPNWNGRDLLEKYLPSVVTALADNPENEIIVVDNGSEDGSAGFVRERFPAVKVLALEKNLGFGGGSNAGFRKAKNDIVVLLNSDMRVAPDFLAPLLEGFDQDDVFAVSCQIFFSDPDKKREETGLTQAWWDNGALRVRHRIDDEVKDLFPCFYGGGGSCAFDRRKFLELGGFDHLLRPFYLEDTDLGYLAWKRGWKVLYQPRSIVYHEHRGTIGKRFSQRYIQEVLHKNFILFCWKNIHEPRRLLQHHFFTYTGALLSAAIGDSPERANLGGILRAFRQLPGALASRWRARALAAITDTEAFRRPLGAYYRDRFEALPAEPAPLRVLFVSPYPICPPIHGGGVFMYHTVRQLTRHAEVHLIALLDHAHEREAHAELDELCASTEYIIRMEAQTKALGSIVPHAVREFANSDLEWLIHRQVYTKRIDAIQLEYTQLAQYACPLDRLVTALFEHDIYFQSIARGLGGLKGALTKPSAAYEYLRALRFELRALPRLDLIQVCSRDNGEYLLSYLPALRDRVHPGQRAGIDTSRYAFAESGREPGTILFLGSFRHLPNAAALEWFVRQVMPRVLERCPAARLVVIGSDPPPRHSLPDMGDAIELRGFVEDVREPLARYAVFACPILSGSGVRVKLLEAFAAGIPVVSTRLGAEGLAWNDGEFSRLADDPAAFADAILELFAQPVEAAAMARRAREEVCANWDMAAITARLAASYRDALARKRSGALSAAARTRA
ncbi:MAG: glycosyltransferase [Bryobacteraceae bacterium]